MDEPQIEAEPSEPRSIRQRVRSACKPCKDRKKRCNGENPCDTCIGFEYECYYVVSSRKRRKKDESVATRPDVPDHSSGSTFPTPAKLEKENHSEPIPPHNWVSREEYSGNAFPKILMGRLDPGQVDRPAIPWNLGMGQEPQGPKQDISRIVSLDQMLALVDVYFDTVHQVFGFINKQPFVDTIVHRWSGHSPPNSGDIVLSGVAALGSLFNAGCPPALRESIANFAKGLLETTNAHSSLEVAAWLLRTLYLRITSQPHAAWIASCTMMHTIQATDIGQISDSNVDGDIIDKERLVWVSRASNCFISREYGRPTVELETTLVSFPTSRPGDFTHDLVYMYQLLERLHPDKSYTAVDDEAEIAELSSFRSDSDGIILFKAHLGLILYRRLQSRSVTASVSSETVMSVISLGKDGVDAALRFAKRRQPWWHVANVTFQFVCMLLVIDTNTSLQHLGSAMNALQTVAEYFPSRSLSKALGFLRTLVKLTCDRKKAELDFLEESLKDKSRVTNLEQVGPVTGMARNEQRPSGGTFAPNLNSEDFINFDWDAFFKADIPVLDYSVIDP
ncbi:Transcription factor [Lachnellula subtilissima]|uniref:Transcription factor n=1 Tax=Lachnellula subtilissima TaxID=602034 RepID=A0A8H8U576_9HELO|nr:Transcription factor [Lachnellula subtilissima]